MSADIAALIERARYTAQRPADPAAAGTADRQRLERVAQEFESMLLVQMLRDMRKSGQWEEEDSKDTFGAESLYDTLDVELAGHLARVQGFGLSQQLLGAFDRMNPVRDSGLGIRDSAALGSAVSPNQGAASNPESPIPNRDISGSQVTSAFGWRSDPFTGTAKFHKGVDLRAAYGQEIGAAAEGRVVFSGEQGGYGTTVLVEHPDGSRTRYAHLSEALVATGDPVAHGQPLGRAGRSGRATGTHLHFEVIAANGQRVDPNSGGMGD